MPLIYHHECGIPGAREGVAVTRGKQRVWPGGPGGLRRLGPRAAGDRRLVITARKRRPRRPTRNGIGSAVHGVPPGTGPAERRPPWPQAHDEGSKDIRLRDHRSTRPNPRSPAGRQAPVEQHELSSDGLLALMITFFSRKVDRGVCWAGG